MSGYDPFARGPRPVGVETVEAEDAARERTFPVEIWYPALECHAGEDLREETQDSIETGRAPRRQSAIRGAARLEGKHPLVAFSHHSGGHRRAATYLCTHLASHGYLVAALDHSEVVAPALRRPSVESDAAREGRVQAMIASRVPDLRFLVDFVLGHPRFGEAIDARRVGVAGHSFGGWTALAAADIDERIRSAVALAPGGSARPKPGILPLELSFERKREVPVLYLVAENDVSLPLEGMLELFERNPSPKRMFALRRADHLHFIDGVEEEHEAVRAMPFAGVLAWIPREMRPIAELTSGATAHRFVRGLSLAWFDATLRESGDARLFFDADPAAGTAGFEIGPQRASGS